MTVDVQLSDQELEGISELRKRLKGDMDTEIFDDIYFLLRFLRAREFNIDNAETMLKKHLEWRKKNDIQNMMKFKKTELMEKYVPYSLLGFDKEGCVVRYADAGNCDLKGLLSSLTFEEISKLVFYEIEYDVEELTKQSKKLGRNVDKIIYIFDFQNFSFAKATDKKVIYIVLYMLDAYLNNYPERLKIGYAINVSMYFNIFYSVLKTVLPKVIQDKIKIYSDDSYKEDLLKLVDADVLPAFLGGNKTDADGNPLCLKSVKHGETVPQSYYLCQRKKTLAKSPDVKKITLSRATFHEVCIEVKEPGSFLEWEFETKCRDIGFGLFYQELEDGEEKITEIVPIQRIDTEAYPETGTFRCDITGTYVIVFDNTYSWVRAKEIYYRAKVVTPKESEAIKAKEEITK